MGKITKLLKTATLMGAFYLGTQNPTFFQNTSDEAYVNYSHKGNLVITDVENSSGKLEKQLKNVETDNFIYTIQADYLPDNEFIYRGLAKRIETADQLKLPYLREDTQKLENLIQDRLFDTIHFNETGVKQLNLTIKPNNDGKLEAVLEYNKRRVILTKENLDYLAEHGKRLEDAELDTETKSNIFLYLGIIGILSLATAAYFKARKEFPT